MSKVTNRHMVVFVVIFLFCSTIPNLLKAQEREHWSYQHFNTVDDPKFRTTIVEFLNLNMPNADGIRCTLSGGRDFHIWARRDDADLNYSFEIIGPTQGSRKWGLNVLKNIERGKIVPCAFNRSNELWIIKLK